MIYDNPRHPDESTLTRYHHDTDRDLSAFALRYGTNHDRLLTFDGDHDPHWTGHSPTRTDIERHILSGELFTLEVPAEELRASWAVWENQTGHEVTVADAVHEINSRPTSLPQPHVTADLLWSYAVNAGTRAEALHGRSEGERYSFDLDPARARLASRLTLWFPVVQGASTRPVNVSPNCPAPLSPQPAWMPSYHHKIAEIERLAHRLDLVRRHVERLQLEGAQKVALTDFVLELVDSVLREQTVSSSVLLTARYKIHVLRQSAHEHMVRTSVQRHRPMWFQDLDRVSRQLSQALSDRQFLEWQDFLWTDGAGFPRDAATWGTDLVLAEAVEALALAGTDTTRRFFGRSQSLVDGQSGPPADGESLVTLFLRKFYSTVVSAGPIAISNTPGPPSIAGVVFAYQMFYGLAGQEVAASVGATRRTRFTRFFTQSMSDADSEAFELALRAAPLQGPAPRPGTVEAEAWQQRLTQQNRANRAMGVLRRSLGTGANTFALACSMLALVSTVWDATHSDAPYSAWQWTGFSIAAASGVTSTSAAVLSYSGVQSAARMALGRVFPSVAAEGELAFGARLGTLAGRVTGVLAMIQGIYQIADYTLTDSADRRLSNLIAGGLALAGGALTIAATCEAIPGLQVVGILVALGGIVAASWPHDGDNFKAVIAGLVDSFKTEAIEGEPTDRQYYDSFMGGGFGNWSFYGLVVGEETAEHPSSHPLAQAHREAVAAIGAWPGVALRDNADNRAYLRRHHFSQEQIEAILD